MKGGGKENKESVEESFVYIPVKSYGGDVACLRSMLAAINAAKSEFSDKGRKLKIVTHALGDIASCGFIFYMMGDERLAVESARFLCHQPSVGVVPESERTATDDAEKLYCNLKFTEEDIYDMAESSLFSEANIEEYEMSNLKRKREEERKKWAKERHLALIALHNSLQLQGEDNVDTMITKLETDGDENVFKFTTEKVCKDTHDCFIIAFDFYAIGMCHHPGVNINYEERYSIIAKRDDPYWSRMHRRHHDLFEPRHNDSPQPKTKSE